MALYCGIMLRGLGLLRRLLQASDFRQMPSKHSIHGGFTNAHIPAKTPMLKAWIEERSNRPYQGLSRESASTGHPTMPESPACETFGTFVGI